MLITSLTLWRSVVYLNKYCVINNWNEPNYSLLAKIFQLWYNSFYTTKLIGALIGDFFLTGYRKDIYLIYKSELPESYK